MKKDEVKAALAAAYMDQESSITPTTPIVINTGCKLVLIDTGTGEAGFDATQGHDRPVPDQSRGRRARAEGDRYGHHLALSRRPHQRPAQGRQFARVPECRNPGAGEGAQVLDG